jgi:hypothetical protein
MVSEVSVHHGEESMEEQGNSHQGGKEAERERDWGPNIMYNFQRYVPTDMLPSSRSLVLMFPPPPS